MIKKVIILKPNRPLNFSESCNAGIKASKNNMIFIANDDIIISKGTLEELVKHTDDNTVTGPDSNCNLGWLTNYAYQVKDVSLVPAMSLNQIQHVVEDIYNINVTRNEIIERDWLAFFATMITRKSIEKVGLLDENFIYDREDLDWCIRAKQVGVKFKQIFASYCFHFGGVSRKKKHKEMGLKHDLDQEHNELYYKTKFNIQDKKIIAFYCYDAWEYWDENSLNVSISGKPNGIGGSETQVILLSKELAKLGYKVKIFNKCKEQHFDTSGVDVEYIPFQNFEEYSKKIVYDCLIASRYLNCFDVPFKSKKNYVMIHDVFLILNNRTQHQVELDKVDKYLCLSHRHKKFVSEYHKIPEDKILVTSNGLDLTRFEKKLPKNPYRLIYSSSPDRGLDNLLILFDKVKEHIPELELHVYYGFENFKDQNYVKLMLEEIKKREDVHYHGRVGQDVLAEEFQKSNIWAYSTNFEETFSISALEAMAAGAIVLSSHYWGLIDTVKDSGILLPMHDNRNTCRTPEYHEKWVKECVNIIKNKEYAEHYRNLGYERVKKFTWEHVAKQWHSLFSEGIWKEIQ
jgi:glycosyltransferase involved in cell wall biosynthesis